MSMKPKTLHDWQCQLEQILLNIREQFLKLGETLYHAKFCKELSPADYDQLLSYVGQWGIKPADIRAAIAAYRSTQKDLTEKKIEEDNNTFQCRAIDPALVFAGAKNSKILFMDEQDQKLLLSDEKFPTLMSNGKPDKPKGWKEMTEPQRNTLIGKGGKILSIGEQLDQMRGKNKSAIYPLGSVEGHKDRLMFTSRNGVTHMQASYTEFARMLLTAECWDTLVAKVEELQQETGDRRAAR